ncbi:Uncharacterised protein [Mycobacterium tuberculosis]|nr:Uncharacterised protein [Mycobacterium tuberculosis]
MHRLAVGEEQRVDLRDGAVDAPHGPHFAPVEDELALNFCEFHGLEFRIFEISVKREM